MLLKCNEVALHPDVFGQTDSVKSAAYNYVSMQGQFQNTIQRERVEKRERRHSDEKLLQFIFGSVKTSDSMQQAALKLVKESL